MGFSAALYVYPKYKDTTYKDMNIISHMLEYENSEWAQSKFINADEYAKYMMEDDYVAQPVDRINFYRKNSKQDEYGGMQIWKEICYWCSNGTKIYDYLMKDENSSYKILTKEDVADFMQYCLDNVLKGLPQSCEIIHAYKYQRDEDGEIPEDADITLFNVDGFEIEFVDDEGNRSLRRVDTNPEWECDAMYPEHYVDSWEYNGYIIGLQACAKIFKTIDFDEELLVYNGGW